VKDRYDIAVFPRLTEYYEVGKALKQGPAGLMRRGGELLRVGCDPRYGRPQRFPKLRDHVRRMSVIPVDRLGEVGAGSSGKEDAWHSSRLPDKVAFNALPGSRSLDVVVKGRDAAIKLARLRGSQLNLFRG
jgi:hypothetical protein